MLSCLDTIINPCSIPNLHTPNPKISQPATPNPKAAFSEHIRIDISSPCTSTPIQHLKYLLPSAYRVKAASVLKCCGHQQSFQSPQSSIEAPVEYLDNHSTQPSSCQNAAPAGVSKPYSSGPDPRPARGCRGGGRFLPPGRRNPRCCFQNSALPH